MFRMTAWLVAFSLVVTGVAVVPAPQAARAASSPLAPPTPGAQDGVSPRSGDRIALGPVRGAARVAGLEAAEAAPNVPTGAGPTRNGTFLTFQLADSLELKVNVGSGNALVRTVDMTLPGISRNASVGAAYNSLMLASNTPLGSIGNGWRTRLGVDVRLFQDTDGSVTYIAADGVSGVFTPSGSGFTAPKEFKADLVTTTAGWKLTDHETGDELSFTKISGGIGRLDQILDRNDNATLFSYSGDQWSKVEYRPRGATSGRSIGVAYNSAGLISEYSQFDGVSTIRRATYAYDSAKNLTSITEPQGEVLRFGYDTAHNLTSITNGRNAETRVTYAADHRVTSVNQVKDDATGDGSTTRLAYPSASQTQVADPNTDLSIPVADVAHTTYTVDSASKRVTQTTDPAGKTRNRSYTPFFDVATATNAVGGTTTNGYAANNGESLTRSTSSTGASVSFAYANPPTAENPTAAFQPSSSTDAQGNATAFTYNGTGNLATARDALGAQANVDYNADGTVKTSTDPANGTNSSAYAYDANHQLAKITPPTGNSLGVRQFTYDGFGRLETATDGAGRTTTFTYDLDDRVKTVAYSDGSTTVTFGYDNGGNLFTRSDASGTTTWAYNKRNMVNTRTNTAGGGTLTYIYDAVGNLTSLTDGRGTTNYTDYNTRNLLTAMTDAAGKRWAFAYDDDGRRTHTFFNSSSDTSYAMRTKTTYDSDGRITRITTVRASSPSNVVSDVSYCYAKFVSGSPCPTASSTSDTALRQWSRDEQTGTVSQFTYDKGNHLTRATNVDGHSYDFTYDANANRTTQKVDGTQNQALTFNSANQISTAPAAYDGAGNQTTLQAVGGNYALAYNAAGQMTKTTAPAANGGAVTTLTYAGPDQVELTAAGSTHYVYGIADQFNQPWIQSFTRSGQTGYIERDGNGTPLGLNLNGADNAYVTDALGSVIGLIDANGNIAATYGYDPYGTIGTQTGTAATANPIRYTGGLALDDTNTRLTKLGHRYDTTQYGRFTQQDTHTKLADPTNGNRYAYAACNPTNYVDPTGRDIYSCLEAAGLGIGGGLFGLASGFFGIVTSETGIGAAIGFAGYTFGAASFMTGLNDVLNRGACS